MKRIGIGGVPGSGKSQFRRAFVHFLRELDYQAEHYDADRFKSARCPEDADMQEPGPVQTYFHLVEDVRLTVPHKPVVQEGEKEGAWQPLEWYDTIIYLRPDWRTIAMNWASRALQWQTHGTGEHMRESGSTDFSDQAEVLSRVNNNIQNWEKWLEEDIETLCQLDKTGSPRYLIVEVRLTSPHEEGTFSFEPSFEEIAKFLGAE
jgi:hypothetical protein